MSETEYSVEFICPKCGEEWQQYMKKVEDQECDECGEMVKHQFSKKIKGE